MHSYSQLRLFADKAVGATDPRLAKNVLCLPKNHFLLPSLATVTKILDTEPHNSSPDHQTASQYDMHHANSEEKDVGQLMQISNSAMAQTI
jgi:hypothetical protein